MWDRVGIAGVLLAAVPLTLTLVRDFSRSKRLEQAMRLRDRAPEGSYARASLDRLVDLEAETMLIAAAKLTCLGFSGRFSCVDHAAAGAAA